MRLTVCRILSEQRNIMMVELLDKHFLYVSDLMGKKVVCAGSGKTAGKISDVIVTLKSPYPEITSVFIKKSPFRKPLITPWENITPFELPFKKLQMADPNLLSDRPLAENEMPVCEIFMDKQIVDTEGAKVVRINDLHLLKENHKIWLVHMDIGLRGFLRRLGWLRTIDTITGWLVSARIPNRLLSWKHVQSLPTTSQAAHQAQLKLKVVHQKLNTLHPADLTEIMQNLSYYERIALFRSLDTDSAAETLEELSPESQRALIEAAERIKVPDIVAKMSPDKAADLLATLSQKRRNEIMKHLPPENREELTHLSSHPEQTAGGMMTTDFISLPSTTTAAQAFDAVRQSAGTIDALFYIYVVNAENALLGVVTMRRLLQAKPEMLLTDIMNTKVKKLTENSKLYKVARMFLKYKFGSIPVVDSHNRIKGVILFKDAMSELLPQMEVTLPR